MLLRPLRTLPHVLGCGGIRSEDLTPKEEINSRFWQVKTSLTASQLSSVANKTYLKNTVTGGTNAGVVITNAGGKEFDYSKISQIPLTLAAGAKSSPIGVIKAQFIHTTNTAATAGRYNFLLPLTVTYN